MKTTEPQEKTYKELYEKLVSDREPYLHRARECSKLTIPHLFPEDDQPTAHDSFDTPYQSIGTEGVNNLAGKIAQVLFPQDGLAFRLDIDPKALAELQQASGMDKTEVESLLSRAEASAKREIERVGARRVGNEIARHLIVGGNVATKIDAEGNFSMFPLQQYVVRRDSAGTVLEAVIKERVSPMTLSEEQRKWHKFKPEQLEADCDVYTKVWLADGKYHAHQEINDIKAPSSTKATYIKNACAYQFLRWVSKTGEHYGRSHVEEYYGDLFSYEGISQSILEFTAASAKVIFGVRSGTGSLKRRLAKARSGDFVDMEKEDVFALTLEKYPDFRVVLEKARDLEGRLSRAFLLRTSVRRDAERVTAEEIRYIASELEDALGGVYSTLGVEAQGPWVRRWIHVLKRQKKFPQFPEGSVEPIVITGMDALNRNREVDKVDLLLQRLAPLGGEIIAKYLNVGGYIRLQAANMGINTDGLIYSEEEIAKAEEDAAALQAQQSAAGPALTALINAASQGMTPNG